MERRRRWHEGRCEHWSPTVRGRGNGSENGEEKTGEQREFGIFIACTLPLIP